MVKVWALLSDNETYYKMLICWNLIVLLFRWSASTSKKLRQPKVVKKTKKVAWILNESNLKEQNKGKELQLQRDLAVFSRLKT